VLLAGGSGLSPMVSIAKGADAAGLLENRKLHFFYGGRSPQDMFDPSHVLGPALAPKLNVTTALSDPSGDWTGPTGLLPDVVRDMMGEDLQRSEIYFAGPAAMSTAVQQMAHKAGVPMDRLHFDEFY
jgi:toluene monooxygenase electron transfer component